MFRKFLPLAGLCALLFGGGTAAQAQLFFEADAVFFGRDNDSNAAFLSGPQPVSTNPGTFSVEPGYRLRLGASLVNVLIDTSLTQVNPWVTSSAGQLTSEVVFDDTANNGAVVGSPPADALTGLFALRTASLSSLAGADESDEGELLQSGANYSTWTRADYRDFELNIGSNYNCRWWRMSGGYRHIKFNEVNRVQLGGLFDAIDSGGAAGNDGLSNEALTNAGMSLVSGAGDGFDAAGTVGGPDNLAYQVVGRGYNELNGAQFTLACLILDVPWISVEGYGKAGIYRNNVSGRVQETVAGSGNDDSVYQRILSNEQNVAAFAGNVGIRAMVALTDYISLVGGYEVLFLEGLALSGDQVNGLSTSATNTTIYRAQTDGSVIVAGANVGLQVIW